MFIICLRVCVLYYRNYITGTSYIPTVWTKQHGQTVMKLCKLRANCQIYPTNELVCRHCGFVVSFVTHKTNVLSWEALSRGDKSTIKKACCTHGQLGEKHRLNDKPTARTGRDGLSFSRCFSPNCPCVQQTFLVVLLSPRLKASPCT